MTNRIGGGNQEALFARREAMAARLAQLNAARAKLQAQAAQGGAGAVQEVKRPTGLVGVGQGPAASGRTTGVEGLVAPGASGVVSAGAVPAAGALGAAAAPSRVAPSSTAGAPDGGWEARRSDFERILEYLGGQAGATSSLSPGGGVVAGTFFDYGAGTSAAPFDVEITQSAQSATLFLDFAGGASGLPDAAKLEFRGSSGTPVQLEFPAGSTLADIAADVNATPELGLVAFVEDGVLRVQSVEPGSAEFVSVRAAGPGGGAFRVGQALGDDAQTPAAMTAMASGIAYSDLGQDIQGTVNGQRAGSYGNRLLAANGSYAVYLDLAMAGTERAAQTLGRFSVGMPV
jgi:hypothetical protein